MRAAFYTLGCKVNQFETEAMREMMERAGWQTVDFTGDAEVYVINSCTVTENGDKKSLRLLCEIKEKHPEAITVLTGCFPQAFPDEAGVLGADIVTGTKDRSRLPALIDEFLKNCFPIKHVENHLPSDHFEQLDITHMSGHTRAFLKIQDGCDRYCSYCIIPTARGFVRSLGTVRIESDTRALVKNGYKEIVLTGINLSLYGKEQGLTLPDAVEAAVRGGAERIRLGSLEPELLCGDIIDRLHSYKQLCPQFHLSLQSGCDKTLRAMRRRYDTALYTDVTDRLRKAFEGCAITTDVMVGFSGETEDDFLNSLDFVKKTGFARVHVFPYSVRPGTAAEDLPDRVSTGEKKRRSHMMQALADELAQSFCSSQTGKKALVLFEKPRDGTTNRGYTENYTEVLVKSNENLRYKICEVMLTGAENGVCTGKIVKKGQ